MGQSMYVKKENMIKLGGWILSFLTVLAGAFFIWPHLHTALLGIALIYLGVRIFNFSTFEEYKEDRVKLLLKLSKR